MSRSRLIGFFGTLALIVSLATVQSPAALAAGVWWVDNTSASCSDSGLGTSTAPFCTISRAAAQATSAGDQVTVRPGTYTEQVTVPVSATATAASPITFTASAPGVVVKGTSDFSDAVGWTAPAAGATAWSRIVSLAVAPTQVLSDGVQLTKATAASTMTSGSFFYDFVAKTLYVDQGGANPATGHVLMGSRAYGFKISGTSPAIPAHDVVVNGIATSGQNLAGFGIQNSTRIAVSGVTATQSTSYGILAQGSTSVTVANVTAANNGSVGIRFLNTSGSTITNSSAHDNGLHGISLQTSPNNIVAGNTSFRNINPVGVHVATGIDVSLSSTGVTVERNTTFGNSDSGIEIYTGSSNAVVRRNVSYNNGDHGLDCLSSPGEFVVGNTVVGNTTAGINLEGPPLGVAGCGGSVVANNISSDNGTAAAANTHGEIRLDKLSWQLSTVNRNLVFRTDGGFLYEWNASPTNLGQYSTVAAFNAATGQEANGIAADPRFLNLAARDLRLQVGSRAIDSADLGVSSAVALDRNGRAPVDLLGPPYAGAGTPAFADRGALEAVAAPTTPRSVTAVAGNAQAVVSWTAPARDGGAPVTGYTVTASPGGRSATTVGATTATVTGLTNGTSYTFTVTATNSIGTSPVSAPSTAVTPTAVTPMAPTGFTGMSPTRVLDTRVGTGVPTAKLGAGQTVTLTVPGLPSGITSVALNVTVTNPTAASFLTVYPGGSTRPFASNLNFVTGQTIPNMVLVPVGAGNTVTFYNNSGTVDVVADLIGYYK